jgi:hypothetical protein
MSALNPSKVSYAKFKNIPNCQLVATSFDATHMEKFLQNFENKGYTKPLPQN